MGIVACCVSIDFRKGERRMEKKFRALRTLATLFKILGWLALIGGILTAAAVVLLGTLAPTMGVSPLVADVPVLNTVTGLISALVMAGTILIYVLLQFLVLFAISEGIHLAIAIEQNTRETAYYLRGESAASAAAAAPTAVTWNTQAEPSTLDN